VNDRETVDAHHPTGSAGPAGPGNAAGSHLVGSIGVPGHARVSPRGLVAPGNVSWTVDWWIGADDRWHTPAVEAAVRQSLVDGMPVVRTAMRIPGGDAVHQVAALPEPDEVAVVDVTNDSPGAFVLALVIRDAASVELEGTTVYVDGRPALRVMRAPSRWATGTPDEVQRAVVEGDASDDEFVPVSDPAGGACAALLFPVAHRSALRAAVTTSPRGLAPGDGPGTVPTAAAVARGWRAQLDRAMRVELPDPQLQAAVDTARAAVLLAGRRRTADPAVAVALDEWGFDVEALLAWRRLPGPERRRLRRRASAGGSWADMVARAGAPDAEFLTALRAALVRDDDAGVVFLPEWPDEWRGLAVDVRDAPTRRGTVSFAVRWHGTRPALLWEVPAGTPVRAPGLDPAWSSNEPAGETLLAGVAR
jgi:hypothetical protein